MHRLRTALFVITLTSMTLQTAALAAGKPADREDITAYALQRCLDNNDTRSGNYAADQLRDLSYLLTTYAMDNAKAGATDRLHRFVDANTAGLDESEVPMKDEARRGAFDRIFVHCMAFYRLPALNQFIARAC
ncbi:hypothetical protein ADT25_05700 [Xanthomonas oryzae]|uniref:Secreted protein n=1 Tax=Xanthomonas oryzae TaxID=347 RepID=A0AAP0ZPN7_9XANT|nr:hypothetical protein [Xanthomonas oryzae]KOR46976.1 hypothetical protein ADT25_05700 [Xanthomonas oryzae]QBG84535.1 hypothetical protein EYR27_12395 [Xanthomonas oryzae]